MTESNKTPRIRRIQRIALALLVLSGVVNPIDRATLAVVNPLIRQELGLSVADMGLLLSAFLWACAFSQLPVGALVDRLGPRLMLGLGLGLWSLAQAAGGVVNSITQFFAARAVLGIGEAPQFPTAARVSRLIMGVLGVVVAVIAYAVYRNPSEVALAPQERAHLAERDVTGETSLLRAAGVAPVCSLACTLIVGEPIPAAE